MSIRDSINYRLARHTARYPAEMTSDRPMVTFTFDDFPKSAATTGAQILESRGVRGSFFATASYMGKVIDGVRQFDDEDIGRLATAGHEIGCHTARHRRLTDLKAAAIEAEFRDNAALMEAAGPPERRLTMAYPYGDVSPRVKRIASHRYDACRGVWAGLNEGRFDRMLLKCVCLEPHVLAQKSAADWIDMAVERSAWLIFLTHDISNAPTDFGITPAALESAVDHACNMGADVLPLSDALARCTFRRP